MSKMTIYDFRTQVFRINVAQGIIHLRKQTSVNSLCYSPTVSEFSFAKTTLAVMQLIPQEIR